MQDTWPAFNAFPAQQVSYDVRFPLMTDHKVVAGASPAAQDVALNTYEFRGNDLWVEVWSATKQHLFPELAKGVLQVITMDGALPFVRVTSHNYVVHDQLPDDPDDTDLAPVCLGDHSHSLLFTTPISVTLAKELELCRQLDEHGDPQVFLIVLTYKAGDKPVLQSRFLANYVDFNSVTSFHPGSVLNKTTVFQAFLAETFVPASSAPLEDVYADLIEQATVIEEIRFGEQNNDDDDEDEDDDDPFDA